jgi:hypothetical protein
MPTKHITYLLAVMLFAVVCGKAQTVAYSMSPLAATGTGYAINGGSYVVGDGSGKCLVVASNGMSVLASSINSTNKGVYGASCEEKAPVADLFSLTSVNLYPNPAHVSATLKCTGNFDANLSCMLRVTGMDGRVMMSRMVPIKELQAGYTIQVSNYAVGTYVVTVEVMGQQYASKLIKI